MGTSIRTKILGGFLLVIVLAAALSLYSGAISEGSLEASVGRNSVFLAEGISKRISHDIYTKIGELQTLSMHSHFQETLRESNSRFKKLGDVEGWIRQRETKWGSAPKGEITPLMRQLIDNELSRELREEFIELYERKHGYRCISEILVTNRYGAVVAETKKTPRYRQDNQSWWQDAKNQGFYLAVSKARTEQPFAISVGIRVEDEIGEFMGAMKAVLIIKGIVREAEIASKQYKTTWIKLITNDGRLIYRTKAFKFMEDVSRRAFFKEIKGQEGFFVVKSKGKEQLYSYWRSRDYRDLKSLGWIVVVAHNADEVLAPAIELRHKVLLTVIALMVLGVFIAFFISRFITGSVSRLIEGAREFGRGNLKYRIEVKSRDEMGELGGAFNQMAAERKEAEEEIISVQARLEHLLVSSPAVIYTSRAGGDYGATFISENIRRQLDYEPSQFVDDPGFWADHIHPEDKQRVLEDLKHLFERDYHVHEYRFLSKDDTYLWMHDEARLIRDKDGNPLEVVGCWLDITDRKMAEEALRASEERLRSAFDSAAIGMAMADPDGRFLQVNRSLCEMTGYSAEELLERDFQSITHPDELEEDLDYHARLLKGDIQYYHTDKRYIHRQGHEMWVHVAVSVVRDMEGKPLQFIGQIQDITETRRAREKVLRQSALLVAINRVFREAMTCETEHEVGRICLEVAEELTGSQFGLIGELNEAGLFDTITISNPGWDECRMPDSEVTISIKNMEVRGIDRSLMREGKSRIVNDLFSHPDRVGTPEGHPPVTSFLGVPLKKGEKTIGMIGLGNKKGGYDRDDQEAIETLSVAFMEALYDKRNEIELINHRQHLENLVQMRTAALERSNKELEQFAYVASHDLQEPLRKVQAFGDRLRKRYADVMDDQGRDYFERMEGATRRMRSMIDDLLSLSRVQTRSGPFAPIDLKQVAQEAVTDLDMLIEQTGGRVEIGDLPIVEADLSQMRQLLGNLISNALKFRKKDVDLIVKIYSKPIREREGVIVATQCQIIVEDNGIGFEEKFAERIFQPFERLHGRGKYEGTGIGLSICRRIVERHGGSITAQSETGRGTRLIVTLPVS